MREDLATLPDLFLIPYYSLENFWEVTSYNNILVQGCRIYLGSDFIIAGLTALSNFTCFITMLFLNAAEQCNQGCNNSLSFAKN